VKNCCFTLDEIWEVARVGSCGKKAGSIVVKVFLHWQHSNLWCGTHVMLSIQNIGRQAKDPCFLMLFGALPP